jgi:hypothetical protein
MSSILKRSQLTLGRVVIAIVALVVVLFVIGLIGTMARGHTSGGCNFVPLVNGQPAHPCASKP